MGLTKGESLVSEEALCLKGIMDEPVTWEYVMLLSEADLIDFFALLQEPSLAKYVHDSPHRWRLYGGFVAGAVQVAWLVVIALLRRRFGSGVEEERVVIQLPPPSVIKKRKKRAYRRRLSTTTIAVPTMRGAASTSVPAEAREAGSA
jgi:hypothetical protein